MSRISWGRILLLTSLSVVFLLLTLPSVAAEPTDVLVAGPDIDLGDGHCLIIKSNGAMYGWGANSTGQLGDGTAAPHSSMQLVSSSFARLATGHNFSVAIRSDGSLWSTGTNFYGELGDSTSQAHTAFARVSTTATCLAVAAGDYHALALRSDGKLLAWGANGYRQLGDGSTTNSSLPLEIGNGTFTAIAAATYSSYGLKADGSLWAWGRNVAGEMGQGTTESYSDARPVGTGSFIAVSGGGRRGMAIKEDGSLWAWGTNDEGELGDGSRTMRLSPVPVGTGSFSAVEAGYAHTLAIKTDGSLWAWGNNVRGQLGDGTMTDRLTPQLIATGPFSLIAAGWDNSLAMKSDGTLLSFGNNDQKQLGTGDLVSVSYTTFKVIQTGPYASFSAPVESIDSHLLLLKADGSLWVCGGNGNGQYGNGTTLPFSRPAQTATSWSFAAVSAGDNFSTGIDLATGSLYAWGTNGSYQLGDLSSNPKTYPVAVSATGSYTAVSSGLNHSVALKSDGTLWSWGSNTEGQLGKGNALGTDGFWAKQVKVTGAFAAVSVGRMFSLALRPDGTLWSWGDNYYGTLGDGAMAAGYLSDSYVPHEIGTGGFSSMCAGDYNAAAVKADGSLWFWGDNWGGVSDAGYGAGRSIQSTPFCIGDGSFSQVATGNGNSFLALKTDGSLWTWGGNSKGQLGSGDTFSKLTMSMADPGPFDAIEVGNKSSYARGTDGRIWAAGNNEAGQFGDGNAWSETPIALADIAAPLSSLIYSAESADQTPDVAGRAGNGATVEFYFDGSHTDTTIAWSDGRFAFRIPTLAYGSSHTVQARTSDGAGNTADSLIGSMDIREPLQYAWDFQLGTGTSGTGDGEVFSPEGMTFDEAGLLYVADTSHHRIQVFNQTGGFVRKWGKNGGDGTSGLADGDLNCPWGIVVDTQGYVYVVEANNNRVSKFTSTGGFVSKWGTNGGDGTAGSGAGEFDSPFGLALGPDGLLYVFDANNYRVQVFTRDGGFVRQWGSAGDGDGLIGTSYGIAVDSQGRVYIPDYMGARMQVFDRYGRFITKWGYRGGLGGNDPLNGSGMNFITSEGDLNWPIGVTVDRSGNVYIADEKHNLVQMFTADGELLGIVGGKSGVRDVAPWIDTGAFSMPEAVAVDDLGRVYVSDADKPYIQRFVKTTPPETALTVSPAAPDGSNGWYRTYPTVSLSADVPANTYFRHGMNDTESYSGPFRIEGEALNNLRYWSVSMLGFAESENTCSFMIDTMAPQWTVSGAQPNGAYNHDITVGVSVFDFNICSETYTLDGGVYTLGTLIPEEGTHSFTIDVTDIAGNRAYPNIFTMAFSIDKTRPTISCSGVEDGGLYRSDITVAFAAHDLNLDTWAFTLDGAYFPVATDGSSVSAEGAHEFLLNATDLAGNAAETVTISFAIDKTAPGLPVPDDGVTGPSRNNTPTFTWPAASGSPTGYEWRVDGGSATATAATATTLGIQSDGAHAFAVRSGDAAGNWSSWGTHAFTIDTIVPAAPAPDDAMSVPWRSRTIASFSWSPVAGASAYEWRIDGGSATQGDGTRATLATLPYDGAHTFSIRSCDDAANWSTWGTHSFSVDTIAPAAPTLNQPVTPTRSTTVSLSGTTTPGTTVNIYQQAIVQATVTPTAGGAFSWTATGLEPYLTHTWSASAVDAAGNESVLSGERSVEIDWLEPTAIAWVQTGPDGNNNWYRTPPSVTFTLSEDGSLFYRWNNGATTAYSAATYAPAEGVNTVYGYGIDLAGNPSPVVSTSLKVDTVPPAAIVLNQPTSPTNWGPYITGAADSGAYCVLYENGEQVAADIADGDGCWFGPTAAEGSHTYVAVQHDEAGNPAPDSNAVTVVYDLTGPAMPTLSQPKTPTNKTTLILTGSADPGSTVYIYDYTGQFSHIATTTSGGAGTYAARLTGLKAMTHAFCASQFDVAGNESEWTPLRTVKIDTQAASVVLTKPLAGAWVRGTVLVAATAGDGATGSGIAKVEFWFNGVKKLTDTAKPYGGYIATGTVSGNKVFKAIAYDKAGNAKTYSRTVTVDNYKPRAAYTTTWLYWKRGGNIKFKTYEFRASPLVVVTATSRIYLGTRLVRTLAAKTVYANSTGYAGYVVWNARNAAGAYVPKGRYIVKTTLKDRAGNTNISSGYLTIK